MTQTAMEVSLYIQTTRKYVGRTGKLISWIQTLKKKQEREKSLRGNALMKNSREVKEEGTQTEGREMV